MYAANNAAGRIDVFNGSWQLQPPGAFTTPATIAQQNLVPFNVQTLSNGNVAVTYAPPTRPGQTGATPGMGAVAIFDPTGTSVLQTILGTILGNVVNPLASPWGITLAPAGFGPFSGDLLVGNFSYLVSEINAFIRTGISSARFPLTLRDSCQAAFGPSNSGPGAATAAPIPSSSPMASTARWMDCLAP